MSEGEMNKYFNDKYGCSYKRLEELFDFEMDKQMKLYDKLEQLQNNWNELKKFVEERIKFIQEEKTEFEEDLYNDYETNNAEITIRRCNLTQLEDVQEQMQELENRKV